MALTTTPTVLTAIKSSAAPGSALYSQIDLLRRQVEAAVKRFCKWGIEANDGSGYGNFVEYYDGKNYLDIVLRNPWVSKTHQVLLDLQGGYGTYNQGFQNATALQQGVDYSLVFERDNKCSSGILRRLGNNAFLAAWWPGQVFYNQRAGGLSYSKSPCWPQGLGCVRVTYDWGFQPLTAIASASYSSPTATLTFSPAIVARPGDWFTISDGNPGAWSGDWQASAVSADGTQVSFRTATNPGAFVSGNASFIPLDIQAAVCEAASIARAQMQYGGRLSGEGLGDYNYNLNFDDKTFFTVRQLLSAWRDVSEGIALG